MNSKFSYKNLLLMLTGLYQEEKYFAFPSQSQERKSVITSNRGVLRVFFFILSGLGFQIHPESSDYSVFILKPQVSQCINSPSR